MKKSTRSQINRRIHKAQKRIDKANWNGQSPMISPPNISLEVAGLNATFQTVAVCPFSVSDSCPVVASHNLTVPH